MLLTLFGASGGTGREIAIAATGRGHAVRAFCRSEVCALPGAAVVLVGALDDPAALRAAIEGADAVVSAFGPRPPIRDVFCAAATRRICDAMKDLGCRRLVCQTGAMIGQLRPNVSWALRFLAGRFAASRPEVARDRAQQEAVIETSGLDWTLLKPPRLRDSREDQMLTLGPDVKVGLFSAVSRGALAKAVVGMLEVGRFSQQRVYVRGA